MRKRIFWIMIVALALLTQCKKPSQIKPVEPVEGDIHIIMSAGNNHGGSSKTDISDLAVTSWNKGDRVYVAYQGKALGGYLTAQSDGILVTVSGYVSGELPVVEEGDSLNFEFYYIGSGVEFTWPAQGSLISGLTMKIKNQQKNSKYDVGEYQIGHATSKLAYTSGVWGLTDGRVGFTPVTAVVRLDTGIGGTVKLSGTRVYNTMTVTYNSEGIRQPLEYSGGDGLLFTGGNDQYVSLIPSGSEDDVTVDVHWYEDEGEGTFPINGGILSNRLYCRVLDDLPYPIILESDGDWVNFNNPVNGVYGLPIWHKYNLGATHEDDEPTTWYGDYYAWGEIEPYYADGSAYEDPCLNWRSMTTGAGNTHITGYNWHTYSQDSTSCFSEWNNLPYSEDSLLLPARDAATVVKGTPWRIPTGGANGEWKELKDNTYFIWTDDYKGVSGYIVYKVKSAHDRGYYTDGDGITHNSTGISGASLASTYDIDDDTHILLPAAGERNDASLENVGHGYYLSSKAYLYNVEKNDGYAYNFYFVPDGDKPITSIFKNVRYLGMSVHPVYGPSRIAVSGDHEGAEWDKNR